MNKQQTADQKFLYNLNDLTERQQLDLLTDYINSQYGGVENLPVGSPLLVAYDNLLF